MEQIVEWAYRLLVTAQSQTPRLPQQAYQARRAAL
jgi:hypothetical protein